MHLSRSFSKLLFSFFISSSYWIIWMRLSTFVSWTKLTSLTYFFLLIYDSSLSKRRSTPSFLRGRFSTSPFAFLSTLLNWTACGSNHRTLWFPKRSLISNLGILAPAFVCFLFSILLIIADSWAAPLRFSSLIKFPPSLASDSNSCFSTG